MFVDLEKTKELLKNYMYELGVYDYPEDDIIYGYKGNLHDGYGKVHSYTEIRMDIENLLEEE